MDKLKIYILSLIFGLSIFSQFTTLTGVGKKIVKYFPFASLSQPYGNISRREYGPPIYGFVIGNKIEWKAFDTKAYDNVKGSHMRLLNFQMNLWHSDSERSDRAFRISFCTGGGIYNALNLSGIVDEIIMTAPAKVASKSIDIEWELPSNDRVAIHRTKCI